MTDASARYPQTRAQAIASVLQRFAKLLTIGLMLQTLCHLLGWLHPFLELASHACFHSMLAAFPVAILLVVCRLVRWAGFATACGLISLVYVAPWNLYFPGEAGIPEENSMRVLCWNVYEGNPTPSAVEALILEQDPDLIVLIEVRPGWLEQQPQLVQAYPTLLQRPSFGGSGIAILSRVPGTELRIEDFSWGRQPAMVASIPRQAEEEPLQLVAMHTLSPLPFYRARIRNRQLASLAEWGKEQSGPVCVCGDLNITPWAAPFRRLVGSGFHDSRNGAGNQPSWPKVAGPLGIPIDHVLTRGACRVLERRVSRKAPGSDHCPVSFTIRTESVTSAKPKD